MQRHTQKGTVTMKRSLRTGFAFLLSLMMCLGMMTGCQASKDPASSTTSREPVDEGRETIPDDSETSTSVSSDANTTGTNASVKPGSTTVKSTGTQKTTAKKPTATKPNSGNDALTDGAYPPLGNNIMPIGAWVAPPRANVKNNNPSFINDTQYKMLKESGINLIYGLYETATDNMPDVQKSLDLCQKYGIKYLVRDSNTNDPDEEMMRTALSKYAKHPAFAGIKVQDEPGANSFERFGEMHPIYRNLLPNKYFYINLLPSYATASQLQYGAATTQTGGTMTFSEYLSQYIDEVKPRFLSYDYYPITGKAGTVENGYFNELSTFRTLGLKHNIPYWVFIQATSYNSNTRRPNEAEILWQVNTALSYGAKGIQYFCYFTPLEDDIFKGSFIDKYGKKTEIYAYGQKANKQIAAVDDVLMNSVSKGVIVSGTSPDPSIPAKDKLTKYGVVSGISQSGAPFITGCFDHKGKDAYYVTNNSIEQSGTATLKFTKSVKGYQVVNGVKKEFSGTSVSVSLKAGEGALIYF